MRLVDHHLRQLLERRLPSERDAIADPRRNEGRIGAGPGDSPRNDLPPRTPLPRPLWRPHREQPRATPHVTPDLWRNRLADPPAR